MTSKDNQNMLNTNDPTVLSSLLPFSNPWAMAKTTKLMTVCIPLPYYQNFQQRFLNSQHQPKMASEIKPIWVSQKVGCLSDKIYKEM